jgi:glycine/D-amino acid oxidase-like deaminating enzyme
VIGCGVVGLSTAILMQRNGWQVTIYAESVPPHTTSNIAGGFWSPHAVSDPGRTPDGYNDRFVRAARVAHRTFQGMVSDHYGVRWIDSYMASSAPQPQPWFEAGTEDLYPQARVLEPDDHPFARAHARMFTTLLIEPYTYLEALMRDFRIASGRLVVHRFSGLSEVARLTEPLIFNCTGMGAKELVNDAEMDPIRGQLTFLLPQPEVDYCVLSGDLYMFPRRDGILLGGTHERGSWSTDPDRDTTKRILRGHADLFGYTQPSVVAAPSGGGRPSDHPRSFGF